MRSNHHITRDPTRIARSERQNENSEQIAAEYMKATNTFSHLFAKSLLAMTHPDFLVGASPGKKIESSSVAAQMMLEQETDSLLQSMKSVEQSYGTDILTLSISCGFIARLLKNVKVERHLEKYHPDILTELRSLIADVKPGAS
jgi:hypothetical protein